MCELIYFPPQFLHPSFRLAVFRGVLPLGECQVAQFSDELPWKSGSHGHFEIVLYEVSPESVLSVLSLAEGDVCRLETEPNPEGITPRRLVSARHVLLDWGHGQKPGSLSL